MTAPEQDLKALIFDLKKAPFKINIEDNDIEVVENWEEFVKKLKAKESMLLDKMKLFT